MLKVRLFRIGKKHQPFFRIIVTDKKNPPQGGRFLEILGFWNPLTKEKNLKAERIKYWLSVGAKHSDTVYNLLISEKIIKGKKIEVHKKTKKVQEEPKKQAIPEKPIKEKSDPIASPVGNVASTAGQHSDAAGESNAAGPIKEKPENKKELKELISQEKQEKQGEQEKQEKQGSNLCRIG